MKLLSLELRQWRSFASCELEFPDGLIGVRGSNGAGKTTIAEAIGWALFGKLRDGAKVGDLRRQEAPHGERSLVRLGFRLGPTVYRVEREVSGPAKFWIGDADEPETSQTRATNERIVQELDLTWETFQRTVFAKQKDVAALDPGGSAEARKKHVERLLGLGRYRVAAEKAKARAKELGHARDALREQAPDLDALRGEVVEAERVAAAGDPAVAAATVARAHAKELVVAAEAAVESERDRSERHGRLDAERIRLTREIAEHDGDLAARSKRLAERVAQQAELASLNGQDDGLDALLEVRSRWERLAECSVELVAAQDAMPAGLDAEAAAGRAAELVELDEELDLLSEAETPDPEGLRARVTALEEAAAAPVPADARARFQTVSVDRDQVLGRRSALQSRVEDEEAHLAAVAKGGAEVSCPTCLRKYGDDYEDIVTAHRDRLAAHRAEIVDLAASCAELDRALAAAEIDLRRAEDAAAALARVPGLDDLDEARAALALAKQIASSRKQRLAELRARRAELKALVGADDEQRRVESQAVARAGAAQERFDAAAAALEVTAFDEGGRVAAVTAHEHAVAMRDTRGQLTAALGATTGLEGEVETLAKRRDERVARAAEVAAELAELALDPAALDTLKVAADTARAERERATDALRTAELQAQERNQHVQELRQRVREAEQAHAQLEERALVARQHVVAGDLLSQYRTAQHQRAWPKLEEGASRLLADTTDGRYADVRLSEDYKLVIVDRGEEHGLERFSGGEQDLANLCLRLSIAEWVSRERNVELGFVVLDEVFGSQDEERRARLLGELRSLGNRFHQLLVITHVPDVADLCEHQLEVRLVEPGRSEASILS